MELYSPQLFSVTEKHNVTATALTSVILIGLVISYVPQLARIIRKGTSEGFSPWYLLLGATSSASGMLNVLVVQWSLFLKCGSISPLGCFESLMGFFQVTLQWMLFSCILVLYLVYFPDHLKYQRILPLSGTPPLGYNTLPINPDLAGESNIVTERINGTTRPMKAKKATTPEWRTAVMIAVVVALHVGLLLLLSLTLLFNLPNTQPQHPLLRYLATFLGISGTLLAIAQYAPQLHRTYQTKVVGALSIGTMVIQVPGAVLFILSLAMRPGVDWTSWLPYAVTALMQSALLILCLVWKRREKQLGLDDFGHPVSTDEQPTERNPLMR